MSGADDDEQHSDPHRERARASFSPCTTNSNAHGPNEFLHVPYAKKLTCCIVHVLAVHGGR